MNLLVQRFYQNNKLLMLALDHRGSFKKLINKDNPKTVDKQTIIEWKKKIISSLTSKVSGILLDVEYGLPAYRQLGLNTPYLLAIEKTGYKKEEDERVTELEYKAERLKKLGASGIKLLIYFNPQAKTAPIQLETAKKVQQEAHRCKLPFFLEIVHYNQTSSVAGSVQIFINQGIIPNVFKLEYPGSSRQCQQVSETLKETPWILLTRGNSFDTFKDQLEIAIQNGCNGFLAGRALWQEVFKLNEVEQNKFLKEILPNRFQQIKNIALK